MPVARARIAGPAWLHADGSVLRTAAWYHDGALVNVTACTYTLIDPEGAVEFTGATSTGTAPSITVTLSDATCGGGYAEIWEPTLAGGHTSPPVVRSAVVMAPALLCPVSSADVLARYPWLTTYPTGQSSWDPQIDEAWLMVGQALVAQTRIGQDVVAMRNPDAMRETVLERALQYSFQLLSSHGGTAYAERAREHRAAADAAWSRLELDYSTSAAAAADVRGERPAEAGGTWPPAWGRRG